MKELLNTPAIVRPADALAELAGRINAEHSEALAAARASLTHAKNSGQLLIQAKEQCGHGHWLAWLQGNVHLSERTAQAYIQIAKRWAELEANPQATADLTIEGAVKLLSAPKKKERPASATQTPPTPPAVEGSLTPEEKKELAELEAKLEEDFMKMARAGNALACGKAKLSPGKYRKWLERMGMDEEYAQEYIEMAARYLGRFLPDAANP
jgi:hypothetical protein